MARDDRATVAPAEGGGKVQRAENTLCHQSHGHRDKGHGRHDNAEQDQREEYTSPVEFVHVRVSDNAGGPLTAVQKENRLRVGNVPATFVMPVLHLPPREVTPRLRAESCVFRVLGISVSAGNGQSPCRSLPRLQRRNPGTRPETGNRHQSAAPGTARDLPVSCARRLGRATVTVVQAILGQRREVEKEPLLVPFGEDLQPDGQPLRGGPAG